MNAKTFDRLKKAAKRAADSSNYKIKLGSVIFKKNRTLSIGYNSTKTHPRLLKYFKHSTLHSECDAVLHCPNKEALKDSEIFIWRESKDGHPLLGKPCSMCLQVLYDHKVKTAIWSIPNFPYYETDLVENMYQQIDKKECYETNCRKPKNSPLGNNKSKEYKKPVHH